MAGDTRRAPGVRRLDTRAAPAQCRPAAARSHHLPANPFIRCVENRTKWINANLYYKNCRRCARTSSSHRRIRFNALAPRESFIYNHVACSAITRYKHLRFGEKLYSLSTYFMQQNNNSFLHKIEIDFTYVIIQSVSLFFWFTEINKRPQLGLQ